jgi:hypothetical protein
MELETLSLRAGKLLCVGKKCYCGGRGGGGDFIEVSFSAERTLNLRYYELYYLALRYFLTSGK